MLTFNWERDNTELELKHSLWFWGSPAVHSCLSSPPPSSFPTSFANNNQSSVSGGASISVPTIPMSASLPSVSAGRSSSSASGGFSELRSSNGSRKARVLYDYDAGNSSELSLLADEVRMKYSLFLLSLTSCKNPEDWEAYFIVIFFTCL